jgi:glycerol-3-phosphate dehydrogenase
VVEGRPETVGELRFAVRAEGVRTVADLLDRRVRIGLVPGDRERAVPLAEQVLAEEGEVQPHGRP